MGISIEIDVKLVSKVAGVEGLMVNDTELLPFNGEIREMYVIHPEASARGTCSICSPYAGEIFKLGQGPQPQLHANCQCERVVLAETLDIETGEFIKPPFLDYNIGELNNLDKAALHEIVKNKNMHPNAISRAKLLINRHKAHEIFMELPAADRAGLSVRYFRKYLFGDERIKGRMVRDKNVVDVFGAPSRKVIYHEVGHRVLENEGIQAMELWMAAWRIDRDFLPAGIAQRNALEGFAEAYAMMRMGKKLPPMLDSFMRTMGLLK